MNLYDDKFFRNHEKKAPVLRSYAKELYDIYTPKSVIDVGCGPGHAISWLHTNGVKVLGLEYSLAAAKRAADVTVRDSIKYCDVTEWPDNWNYPKFDLAISWHMAEHVHAKFANAIIDGMTKLSDVIHWSAASSGQAGVGHVNCKPLKWWENLFNEFGYRLDREATDRWYIPIEKKYGDSRQGQRIRDNAMIFVKT